MEADAAHFAFEHKKLALLGFMQTAKIEPPVVARAHAWLEHWWHAQDAQKTADSVDQLPGPLRLAIRTEVIRKTVADSPLFEPLWAAGPPDERPAVASSRAQLVASLVGSASFDVFNAAEWVLRKGMLNETVFVVASGVAKVMLDDSTSNKFRGSRRGSAVLNIDKYVAELHPGAVFGEMSCMYRSKCVGSVVAITALEVIAFPRPVFMACLHRFPLMLKRFTAQVKQRKKENDYFRFGKLTLATTASAIMALGRLQQALLNRVKKKRAAKASAAAAAATTEV